MSDYLVMQLYAPLVAWGDMAIGMMRHSFIQPSKSAVMGLCAAALGIDRQDEKAHHALFASYQMGIKQLNAGEVLPDYHTAQVPSQQKDQRYFSRMQELTTTHKAELNTILSTREYRANAFFLVALIAKENVYCNLINLQKALIEPYYALYLGRKNCVPALPLNPKIIGGDTLRSAFDQYILPAEFFPSQIYYYWEPEMQSGIDNGAQTFIRKDNLSSRHRWQYIDRIELKAKE